ncbi:hypothetical protein I871_03550 [Borrelia miyamotoi LB-2001]|nr:hypothetical protein I871_03550 [Borrelia miyamotoi LB-2001]
MLIFILIFFNILFKLFEVYLGNYVFWYKVYKGIYLILGFVKLIR